MSSKVVFTTKQFSKLYTGYEVYTMLW